MDKAEITYWLRLPDEDISLLTTQVSKVPEVGEVLHINSAIEMGFMKMKFSHLSDKQMNSLLPQENQRVKDDFVVVDVKRYLKTRYVGAKASELFAIESTSTSAQEAEIPVQYIIETFEVFVEPFKESELTESPIARVRNLLSPIVGSFDILNAIKKNPEKEKELMELFRSCLETASDSIPALLEIVRDDKNWK